MLAAAGYNFSLLRRWFEDFLRVLIDLPSWSDNAPHRIAAPSRRSSRTTLSFDVEAVGVLDEAIEDCVGDGGIPIISYQRSTGNSLVTSRVLDNKAALDSIVAQIAFWSEFFSKLLDRTSPQHFCYVMLEP